MVASNRLPVVVSKESGRWQAKPSSGGLVTALTPVLAESGGLWIGWTGTQKQPFLDDILAKASTDSGYILEPVWLTEKEVDQYYFGFSNEIMWPLFHDLQSRCNFDPAYWNTYRSVNRKFARVIEKKAQPNDYIWVQDYHLMLVARELRRLSVHSKLGFFLHTPFPAPDMYMKLPWRKEILAALLEYDLLGFQTSRDRNNFAHCVEAVFQRQGIDTRRQVATVQTPKREVLIGSFPISIDFKSFAREAASETVAQGARKLRDAVPNCKIVLGVDRLDYSKGVPERLRGFRRALERFPALRGRLTLVQIMVPSREDILQYRALRSEIEGLVGEINGIYSQPGWIPINYIFRSLSRADLLAYYRAADIALVTPLKDGMNLISKEYCAANVDENGVLILSEFAGAASQLGRASLLVNPYDVEGVANAIKQAYSMSNHERQWRMRRARRLIAKRDIHWWVDSFLRTAFTN